MEKYSTYILELIRNNGITDEKTRESGTEKLMPCNFLLFDYFDVLNCRKLTGKDKKYVNYLSIVNVFEGEIENNVDYKVAYKTLSLYCKPEDEQRDSDFFSVQSEGTTLSETPFLGIIQISLCKDNYIVNDWQESVDLDIDVFLKEREDWILAIADDCKPLDEEIKMQRVLFRSSTTGDFCLVIRTNLIKLIYDVAIRLNGTQNDPDAKYKMLTFTNVGIECKYVEGDGYVTLSADIVKRNSEKIALRFSADESIRGELQNYIKSKQATVEGLFGRYEYLLTIGMQEFASLYPFLCERKLGREKSDRNKDKLEIILRKSIARNINERILIGLGSDLVTDASILSDELIADKAWKKKEEEDNVKDRVFDLNNKLLQNIKEVDSYKKFFQEEHFAFQDLIRGMIEIYKSFSSAGMDKESYINWRVFHKDMDVLCRCIREMMKNYKKWVDAGARNESDKKGYRGTILGDWRDNLNAINRYTTLVQHVNYQTYQSPSYEIQTQIDAEKEMVAYREAMELYITDAMVALQSEGMEEDDSRIYPLIYPDLSKEKVSISAPFIVKKPYAKIPEREIICTVPSFEYFARLYDLLPWIIHETSHHLRITNRENRNRFVTDYILSYVLKVAMREPLNKLSNGNFYDADGKAEKYLVTCMVEVAKKNVFDSDKFENFSFETVIFTIEKWLKAMFPLRAGYNTTVRMEEEELLKKQAFEYWLDAYRKEQMLDQGNLCLILKVWDNKASRAEKQELASKLLERYYEKLEAALGDRARDFRICLNDMNKSVLMEKKRTQFANAVDEERVAVREYYEQVTTVYRIIKSKSKVPDGNEGDVKEYFEAVFKLFKENYKKEIVENDTIIDTVSMRVMRNLGLLRRKSDVFVQEMMKIARNVDYLQIMEHKEIKKTIYLEAYADIVMATSLQFTGFGYCRLVLQTASDAKLYNREYEYEDINYERWRTVAAALLVKPEEYQEREEEEQLEIDAGALIEEAQVYCEYVIKHISKKLSESDKLNLEGADREINEARRQSLRELLTKINSQMYKYLEKYEDEINKVLLLDILLHGDEGITNEEVRKEWDEYKEVAMYCDDVKYNLWRLACFCKGIINIVKDGKISVSGKLFYHMLEIRQIATGGGSNCIWERNNKFLTDPKRDVGNFYNDPRQVFEKTPDKKLENTIDFIQNYYYYNRFRVVNTIDSENKKV